MSRDGKIDLSSIQRRNKPDANLPKEKINLLPSNKGFLPPTQPELPLPNGKVVNNPIGARQVGVRPIGEPPTFPENIVSGKSKKKKVQNDDVMDKRKLILALQFYLLYFPEKLTAYQNIKFDKKSIEELNEIRSQMDGIISSKSNLRQTQMIVQTILRTLEFAATATTPIKCEGLANAILQDPECLDDIKHIALKRMAPGATDPEMRLCYKILSNMVLLHNINSIEPPKQEQAAMATQPMQPMQADPGVVDSRAVESNNIRLNLVDINAKYNDL